MKKVLTLCILHEHPRVLLGMKKRGFGEGRWNGFGGKVGKSETVEEATVREMREEAGIKITDITKHGVLDFSFEENSEVLEVHIFKTTNYEGTPTESDEMEPKWFSIDEIPFETMWPDDIYWLPHLLEDKFFKGTFHFGGPNDEILQYTLDFIAPHEL